MTQSPPPDDQLARLIRIVDRLGAPDGCPWDREQTETTMAPHLLEEACEAVDAIERGDDGEIREELGDVLMNVLMIARIAAERGAFDLQDVARAVADKLVRRHPHVFAAAGGPAVADDAAQVLRNWEAIKRREDGGRRRSALAGVPDGLTPLLKAQRVGEKAAQVGFDWPDRSGARAKVDEELAELDRALQGSDPEAIAGEVGDLLFSVVNLARHVGVSSEMALRGTVRRFVERFGKLEQALGDRLTEASLEEMERAWQAAKRP